MERKPLMTRQANALLNTGVDLRALEKKTVDGSAYGDPYVAAKFAGQEPRAEMENAKTYYGGCHCGAVTVAMKSEGPVTDKKRRINECDCSICIRVCVFCFRVLGLEIGIGIGIGIG